MFPLPDKPPTPDLAPGTGPAYLDAFLQGARFALFALEGRLRDDDQPVPVELEDALIEFHDLYKDTRNGIDARQAKVELFSSYLGKN